MADGDAHLDDVALLRRLRTVMERVDPVPVAAMQAARAAFVPELDLDAELAELLYDSALDEHFLAGVRSATRPRLLSFAAHEVTVELQVAVVVVVRRIVGQIVPPQRADVEVRHAEGVVDTEADELGRFIVDDVPSGPVRLSCRCRSLEGTTTIKTDWVVV